MRRGISFLFVLLLSSLLLQILPACTGCGGGGSLIVEITSHNDGDSVTGSKTVTISGTIRNAESVASVTVDHNGTESDATFDNRSFSAEVTLDDRDNLITITVVTGSGKTGSDSVNLGYPFIRLTTFQQASVVIGQADFTLQAVNRGGAPGANTIAGGYGNPFVHNGVLYLPDSSNNRVLGFNAVPTINGVSADFVLGQSDFLSASSGDLANEMSWPITIIVYSGKMIIADESSNRVLIWNTVPTSTQVPADVVVGQAGFGASASSCSQNGLNNPYSVFVVDDKLIVTDLNNNRVLIWNSIPTTNGEPADIVLGQNSFTNCIGNDDDQNGAPDGNPTSRTLAQPTDIWSDGTRLIIADSEGNNRLLIWNSFPTSNFTPADVVIGQPDMTSGDPGLSSRDLDFPAFIFSNGNQLIVADGDNHRVLIWDTIPTTDYAPADKVLGQSDFTKGQSDDLDQDGFNDGAASNRTFDFPFGLNVIGDKLIVSDNQNSRFLIFQEQ